MSDNNANNDFLLQYLDGELEGDALEEARAKISSQPALQKELESLRDMKAAVKSYGLKENVSKIHAQMMQEMNVGKRSEVPVRKLTRAFLRVAASIIFIVLITGIYQYQNLSSTRLFDEKYQPYELREARGNDNSSSLKQLFKLDSMQKVINAFAQIEQPSVQDYFYAANAYLKEHEATMAVKTFKALQQKNARLHTHQLEDDTEYYLALSYLQSNQPDQALPLFEKIYNDKQHLYHDKITSWYLYKLKLLKNK